MGIASEPTALSTRDRKWAIAASLQDVATLTILLCPQGIFGPFTFIIIAISNPQGHVVYMEEESLQAEYKTLLHREPCTARSPRQGNHSSTKKNLKEISIKRPE